MTFHFKINEEKLRQLVIMGEKDMNNMNNNNDEEIDIKKLRKFGRRMGMLLFHYILKEGVPPSEVFNKINSQSDLETAEELKRVGLLEGLVDELNE